MENWESKYKGLKAEYEQFIYIVTHDMKSALRGINTLSSFIKEDIGEKLDEANSMQMDMLMNKVAKMQMIIDGLYSFSKCDMPEIVENVDPKKIIESATAKLGMDSTKLTMVGEWESFDTEKSKLENVFTHLLSNAVIHNPHKPDLSINVESRRLPNHIEYCLSDNGVGIEEKYFSKAFSPLVTLHTANLADTAGMGLSIVKKIADSIGAIVTLEQSSNPGLKVKLNWPINSIS